MSDSNGFMSARFPEKQDILDLIDRRIESQRFYKEGDSIKIFYTHNSQNNFDSLFDLVRDDNQDLMPVEIPKEKLKSIFKIQELFTPEDRVLFKVTEEYILPTDFETSDFLTVLNQENKTRSVQQNWISNKKDVYDLTESTYYVYSILEVEEWLHILWNKRLNESEMNASRLKKYLIKIMESRESFYKVLNLSETHLLKYANQTYDVDVQDFVLHFSFFRLHSDISTVLLRSIQEEYTDPRATENQIAYKVLVSPLEHDSYYYDREAIFNVNDLDKTFHSVFTASDGFHTTKRIYLQRKSFQSIKDIHSTMDLIRQDLIKELNQFIIESETRLSILKQGFTYAAVNQIFNN